MPEVKEQVERMERFRIEKTLDAPGPAPHGLAWDGSHLWMSDSDERRIFKIDPESGQTVLTIPFDGDVAGTAWDGSHLWQVDNRTKTVSRIDQDSGTIATALACDPGEGTLGGLCYHDEDLWLAVTGTGQLRRIRVSDGAIVKVHAVRQNILGIGFDRRRLWYTDADNARVRLVDPATGTELMSYELQGKPTGVAFTDRNVFWFCNAETKKLVNVTLLQRS